MSTLSNLLLLGLLAQAPPAAPPESKKSQEFAEQPRELTLKLFADGHVDLTVRETDKSTGKMVDKNYKAASIEEFQSDPSGPPLVPNWSRVWAGVHDAGPLLLAAVAQGPDGAAAGRR